MRGLRSTIAFVVILAGLGAYIYYLTNKKTEVDDPASKQEQVFAGLTADKIDEITVKSDSGDTTALKKNGSVWQVTSPVTTGADDVATGGLTSFLGTLRIIRVIDANPADLKDYGLAMPRIEVEFKATGDKAAHKLFVGDKSPTGGDLFARRDDDKRVFLISAGGETSLNKTTFELRDKRLIKVDDAMVDGFDVVAEGNAVELSKNGMDWVFKKPWQTKADFGSVVGVLGRLEMVQMKSIASSDASPADLKKFGLDKPAITVTISAGSARTTLLFGNKAADNTYYARDPSKPIVVTVDGMLGDDLKKGADEYRRKEMFELRSFNTNRIEITRDGQTVVLEMVKGTGDNAPNKWRRVSPNPADIDRDKAEGFLTRLSNVHATTFVVSTAQTGLDKPFATVKVKFEDTKEETVSFGRSGKDIYAARLGEPGAGKITAIDFDDAMKALDAVAK